MRHFLKSLIVSAAAVIFVGCASNAGGYTKSSEVEMRLKGMAKSEVANQLGAPTQAIKISDDMEVWTYRTGSVGLTGGQCVISINFDKNLVSKALVNKTDYSPLAAPLASCASIIGNLQ
jgi:outer membrane protein assembly factor BamE (lipoprotein component of BamABCDE complex)